jgi:tetratricopeptide (TPR) repeat protein
MHRDTLFAMLNDREPTLFQTLGDLTNVLRQYGEAFPAVDDGVYWSEIADLQKTARETPTPAAFVAVGRFAWSILHDAARAEFAYSEALQRGIDDIDAHLGLADVYSHQQRWEEALGVLGWLRWRLPRDRKVWANSARCAEKLEKWDLAVDLWSRLVEMNPTDAGALLRLGVAAFEADDSEVAVEALGQALTQDEELALAHLLMARLAFEYDDVRAMPKHLRRALELDPGLVAEQCPGPVIDVFLESAHDADYWAAQLERQLRFR